MKIKTAWLKNKNHLIKCYELRVKHPHLFDKKIEAGRLDEKMKVSKRYKYGFLGCDM